MGCFSSIHEDSSSEAGLVIGPIMVIGGAAVTVILIGAAIVLMPLALPLAAIDSISKRRRSRK